MTPPIPRAAPGPAMVIMPEAPPAAEVAPAPPPAPLEAPLPAAAAAREAVSAEVCCATIGAMPGAAVVAAVAAAAGVAAAVDTAADAASDADSDDEATAPPEVASAALGTPRLEDSKLVVCCARMSGTFSFTNSKGEFAAMVYFTTTTGCSLSCFVDTSWGRVQEGGTRSVCEATTAFTLGANFGATHYDVVMVVTACHCVLCQTPLVGCMQNVVDKDRRW